MPATIVLYMISLILILVQAQLATAADMWPQFYGHYAVRGWTCESTLKDDGCKSSASLSVENVRGISMLTVFDSQGRAIRSNELVEKKNKSTEYTLDGGPGWATFTVQSFDSRGNRYFYNELKLERTSENLIFSHNQQTDMAGLKSILKRIFQL